MAKKQPPKKPLKNSNLDLRISAEAKRQLESQVPEGMTLSAWVREQLLHSPQKRLTPTQKRQVQKVAKMHNLLTQVIRENGADAAALLSAKAMEGLLEGLAR